MRPDTLSLSLRSVSDGLGWCLRRGRWNFPARLSIRTFKGIFPSRDALAREPREAILLDTGSTPVAVIVKATLIAMDFVLAVGAYLSIPRKANALGIVTLHIGSSAIIAGDAISRGWLFSDSNNRCGFLTAGESVS